MPKKSKGQKRAARKKAKAQAAFEAVWGTKQVDLTGTPTPPKPQTKAPLGVQGAHPTVKEALKFVNPKAAKRRAKKEKKKKKKAKKLDTPPSAPADTPPAAKKTVYTPPVSKPRKPTVPHVIPTGAEQGDPISHLHFDGHHGAVRTQDEDAHSDWGGDEKKEEPPPPKTTGFFKKLLGAKKQKDPTKLFGPISKPLTKEEEKTEPQPQYGPLITDAQAGLQELLAKQELEWDEKQARRLELEHGKEMFYGDPMAMYAEHHAAPVAHLPPLPLPPGTALPTNPLRAFRPTPATINDVGNQPRFHTRFLSGGGPRGKIAIAGGHILIRPSRVTISVDRLSRATRQDLSTFLAGRFPLGGNIAGKTYSNTSLLRVVLSMLPGVITIST